MRIGLLLGLFAFLAACSIEGRTDLKDPPVPLGQFNLGHNVVVAPKAVQAPLSRSATEAEMTEALQSAIAQRFDRYEGDRLYHFGVSVEGYSLALPGVPLIYNPKSVLIINLTVWDDSAGRKLNDEPEQITVFESLTGETIVSSGLTQTKAQQLENLSINAAKQIELFLVRMRDEEGWFGGAGAAEAETGETGLDAAVVVPASQGAQVPREVAAGTD